MFWSIFQCVNVLCVNNAIWAAAFLMFWLIKKRKTEVLFPRYIFFFLPGPEDVLAWVLSCDTPSSALDVPCGRGRQQPISEPWHRDELQLHGNTTSWVSSSCSIRKRWACVTLPDVRWAYIFICLSYIYLSSPLFKQDQMYIYPQLLQKLNSQFILTLRIQ